MKRPRAIERPLPVVFRNTTLNARQFIRIQGLIGKEPTPTRQDLARAVCRMFRWRRPDGVWAIRSARQLLVRMAKAGIIELPAPRRVQGRPHRERVETAATLLISAGERAGTQALRSPGASATLRVRLIRSGELLAWRAHMNAFHYLGDAALVGESLRYVAELDSRWAALLSWGSAALHRWAT